MNRAERTAVEVSGIELEWSLQDGRCTFERQPVAMMWVYSTLAGLLSGVQAMVGTKRFLLALQSEGRRSVDIDWGVISRFPDFRDGFKAKANITDVAGWGKWELVSFDEESREACFRVRDSWEGLYQKALGVEWGSGFVAGKFAGYCTRLFKTNCWAEQTKFIVRGDPYDEFVVQPSTRSVEIEMESLLATDEATRADMAVALEKLGKEMAERKQAEENLRASEQRYRALIETTQTGYVIVDAGGRVVDANAEYVRLTGHRQLSEIAGRSVLEWTDGPDKGRNADALERCLASGQVRNFVVGYFDAAHGTTTVEINATTVGQGESRRILALCRDISERLRTEQELQNRQKLEALGVLAGGIAHDFNNLLGGIMGFIDLASKETTEKKIASYLQTSLSTIGRARALTNQLLTFARGGEPVRKVEPLFPFVEESALFALSGSRVSCRCDVPPGLWACSFDRNQVGQVIDNIVINAQQAMPEGGRIELSARNITVGAGEHPTLDEGRYVRVSVKDHGIGMPPGILSSIFDPFFTTKRQGRGLGLAICHSIVRRHGGSMDVESEPGNGSTFHVYLPASAESPVPAADEETAPFEGSGTVLVMDDEEVIREILAEMLRSLGYEAICTSDGQEALDRFVAEREAGRTMAGVILDLTVAGGMGGTEAGERMRTLDGAIPIIVSSGYANDPAIANPEEFGFTASLSKPFLISELSGVLKAHLTKSVPGQKA